MNHHTKKDDAVSPVIGVMLMLVVTIVIAAVVVTFGTGMAGDATTTTPMALYEVDNIVMKGGYLDTFDLVHKGGDEMNLKNLQVTLEPIGPKISGGIILVRTGAIFQPPAILPDMAAMGMPEYSVEDLEGDLQQLTVPGKSGDDVDISTGNRIRVLAQYDGVKDKQDRYYSSGMILDFSTDPMGVPVGQGDESYDDMPSDTLVKWTLSDTRTNGVIAKGEFVVPKA